MNITESLRQIRKQPKDKRRHWYRIILWFVIPAIVLIWLLSFTNTLKLVALGQKDFQPTLLGPLLIRKMSEFVQQTSFGFRQFFSALWVWVRGLPLPELWNDLNRRLLDKPMMPLQEAGTPVPLPIISSSPLNQ